MRKISKKQIGAMGLAVMMTAQSPAMAAEIETSQKETTVVTQEVSQEDSQEEATVAEEVSAAEQETVTEQETVSEQDSAMEQETASEENAIEETSAEVVTEVADNEESTSSEDISVSETETSEIEDATIEEIAETIEEETEELTTENVIEEQNLAATQSALSEGWTLYDDGTYTLCVHIADVSYYVKSGSKLDKEAITRGTSIYMMDRVIPMLPKELSNGICSLNEQKDRFAMSVIMKINEKGKVVDADIFKSVIKTTRRMNYHDVNDIFKFADMKDGKIELADEELARVNSVAEKYKEFIPHFLRMRELKNVLKQRRDLNGSLNLDIPESKIILNENGIAVDIQKYDYLESNEVIEQFMLTANESVAEKFYWLQAPFIYRVHDVPDIEKVNDLNKFLFNLGYKIRGVKKDDEDSIHPKAFAQVLEEVKGKPEERVVSNLILRTLKVAKYESENRGHFGIASKCYCHFTSPIRRYPDLFIHRVISSYLKHDYNINEELRKKYEIEAVKYAESSSEREKIAQKVERDAEDIKKAEYMKDKVGEIYEGVVSSVTPFGMFVELDNTVEGLIRFENMGNEYFMYDDERKTLVGEKSKTMYKIGDSVKIEVIGADKITRKIDFKLCKE